MDANSRLKNQKLMESSIYTGWRSPGSRFMEGSFVPLPLAFLDRWNGDRLLFLPEFPLILDPERLSLKPQSQCCRPAWAFRSQFWMLQISPTRWQAIAVPLMCCRVLCVSPLVFRSNGKRPCEETERPKHGSVTKVVLQLASWLITESTRL